MLLAHAAADDEEFEAARDLWEESAAVFGQIGDLSDSMLATRLAAWAYDELGDTDRACQLKLNVLEQARALGDKYIQMHALESLAHAGAAKGQIDEAMDLLREAYELNKQLGDVYSAARLLCRFARVLAFAGRPEDAANILAAGLKFYDDIGGAPMGWLGRANEEALTLIRSRLDEAAFDEAWEDGRKLSTDEAVALALEKTRVDA